MSEQKDSQTADNKNNGGSILPTSENHNDFPPDIIELIQNAGMDRGQTAQLLAVITKVSRSHQGPLPSAEQFALYERACPGAGERILNYMDREQETRHKIDDIAVRAELDNIKRGQWLGFIIMFSLVILAGFSVYAGNTVLAGIIAFLTAGTGFCIRLIEGRPSSTIKKATKSADRRDG